MFFKAKKDNNTRKINNFGIYNVFISPRALTI